MAVMTNTELANKLIDIAKSYKTLYVMGCFGAPMTEYGKNRYTQNHSYNKQSSRTKHIMNATADTFGFDCVCLIKGVLWGWNGNQNHIYGGASYASNGVPDIGADTIIKRCTDVSSDFSNIEIGELVHMTGHVGVYVGNGLAVECTPKWSNNVQLTACNCDVAGYNRRNWSTHGKLPYVEYLPTQPTKPAVKPTETVKKSNEELAKEVIQGKWGNGQARKDALTKAGYNYSEVQTIVNEMLKPKPTVKTNEQIAKEVIRGNWGNGAERKRRLQAAGYNYRTIQNIVNEMLRK